MIEDRNWKLVRKEGGAPVCKGDVILDFRGDSHTVTGGQAPLREGSTGKVMTDKGFFYPSVINCEWVLAEESPAEK